MTPNPWRGEVEIVLDGKPYVLRPTFAALSAMEQQFGMGLVALAGKLAAAGITLEELAVIITVCALETLPQPSCLKDALVRGGLASVVQAVGQMFAAVFGGCDETGG